MGVGRRPQRKHAVCRVDFGTDTMEEGTPPAMSSLNAESHKSRYETAGASCPGCRVIPTRFLTQLEQNPGLPVPGTDRQTSRRRHGTVPKAQVA